ncbi:MAG: hypothetical protein J6C87_08920 [Bacteroides sp.]|nr:hypothetical protein [Bacteroides sp.]
MKNLLSFLFLLCISLSGVAQESIGCYLPGFVKSPYFDEQVMYFTYEPNVKVHINAPSARKFDARKPTRLMLFALPNTGRTHWCIGRMPMEGDDSRYQDFHIGAQTRFIREHETDYNFVTIYLEADTRAWGRWRKAGEGRDAIIRKLVAHLYNMFADYHPQIELNGHSGGGNFIFGFMDAGNEIPAYVKRISFMDSNYNWTDKRYGPKLKQWLEASEENQLSVICYDDGNALLNGKSFISHKGGTFHHTELMLRYMKRHLKGVEWKKIKNDSCIQARTDNGQAYFYLRRNPERKIYHSRLVELNGYIQSAFCNTKHEEVDYNFFKDGRRAYDEFRQPAEPLPLPFPIAPRKRESMTGSEFTALTGHLSASERDSLALQELIGGNLPNALRQPIYLTDSLQDAVGKWHKVTLSLLPDYLAIGTDEDFLRLPLLPKTAQRVADYYGATLPTRKLSDLIHKHSAVKMVPHPMTPDATMVTMPVFVRHDSLLNAELRELGEVPFRKLTTGHKKDIVVTNRLTSEKGRLYIYGWHYPEGKAIQPLSGAHHDGYVDYSHGVRLISDEVVVDGKTYSLKALLKDSVLYKLFSDEEGVMGVTGYPLP